MRVYAYAALCGLQSLGWDLNDLTLQQRWIFDSAFEEKRQNQREAETKVYTKPSKPAIPRKKVVKSDFMSR